MIITRITRIFRIISDSSDENVWRRNLLILTFVQFIAMVGMNGLVPFLPLFVIELGIVEPSSAKMWSSLIFAGPYFLSIFAVPVWGMLGDRYGQKQMVIRAIFGLCLSVFLMGFSQNVEQLFAFRIFQGIASGFIASALAFVSSNTPKNRTGYAIGILTGSSSAGIIVGPFIGGLFSDLSGIRSVFFIVAALCLIGGLLVILYLKEGNRGKQSAKSSVLFNIKYALNNSEITKIIVLIIITQTAILFSNPIFPFFVSELGAPDVALSTITGSLIAIVGIFGIIFAPYWGRRNDREAYGKILGIATFVAGVGSLLHIVVPHYLWLFPIRGIIGVFFAAISPSLYAALSYRAPEENKGGMMGIASSANLFGALLSYLACSYVASQFDMLWTFVISGVLLLFVAAITYFAKSSQK